MYSSSFILYSNINARNLIRSVRPTTVMKPIPCMHRQTHAGAHMRNLYAGAVGLNDFERAGQADTVVGPVRNL